MGRPTGAHVCGPLQPLVRGFLLELIDLGYSWTAQRSRLRLMAELSSWTAARGIGPEDLTRSMIEEFLGEARSFCLGVQWCSPTSERQVLNELSHQQVHGISQHRRLRRRHQAEPAQVRQHLAL